MVFDVCFHVLAEHCELEYLDTWKVSGLIGITDVVRSLAKELSHEVPLGDFSYRHKVLEENLLNDIFVVVDEVLKWSNFVFREVIVVI